MNWSIVISAVTLVAAIISPIITTQLNNRFQMRVHRQRFYDEHRAETIENFVRSVGQLCSDDGRIQFLGEYGKNCTEIYLYIPENLWDNVDRINSAIYAENYKQAQLELTELCKALNKYPPRFKNNKSD